MNIQKAFDEDEILVPIELWETSRSSHLGREQMRAILLIGYKAGAEAMKVKMNTDMQALITLAAEKVQQIDEMKCCGGCKWIYQDGMDIICVVDGLNDDSLEVGLFGKACGEHFEPRGK